GQPGTAAPAASADGGRTTSGTDLAWLACAIALLDVDVLALEELKSTPRASDALAWLRAELGRLTGRDYRVEVDRCPGMGRQSVGLLWDAARVRGSDFSNLGSLNPLGGCSLLRPGFAGYFRFPGGLDLHVAAVHLKSGDDARSYSLRRDGLAGLDAAAAERRAARADQDLLFLGDFNTMGCRGCTPRVKGEGELAVLDQELSAGAATLTRVPLDRPCTHYHQGRGTALDHVLATRSMAELAPGTVVEVHGHCAALGCRPYRRSDRPATLDALSDHCPVVVALDDRDEDH
ncbi:MAG: endonuclease/exonuclease/phosphatase family protein, partial [Deltaproteobacteria bacterium]|nr:endonuclease/exonuclease/phosphatase family protein [Deltaproteobacteria bacterium]